MLPITLEGANYEIQRS